MCIQLPITKIIFTNIFTQRSLINELDTDKAICKELYLILTSHILSTFESNQSNINVR